MQRGKSICKQLKAVRHRIAEENKIPLEQRECTYDGPCRGTCPRCEAEVRYLEKSLVQRLHLGKAATVAGLSLSLAACGGQQPDGQGPLVKTDSLASPSDTIETTLPPDDNSANRTEQKDIIEENSEIIMDGICIEDDTLPPPPPPPYDETLIVGEVEEGEVRIFRVVDTDPEFPGTPPSHVTTKSKARSMSPSSWNPTAASATQKSYATLAADVAQKSSEY